MIQLEGKAVTAMELRQRAYDSITDDMLWVASASHGAISVDWLMDQPIRTRLRYYDEFKRIEEERDKES